MYKKERDKPGTMKRRSKRSDEEPNETPKKESLQQFEPQIFYVTDIAIKILSYVDSVDPLLLLSLVSKTWLSLFSHHEIWKGVMTKNRWRWNHEIQFIVEPEDPRKEVIWHYWIQQTIGKLVSQIEVVLDGSIGQGVTNEEIDVFEATYNVILRNDAIDFARCCGVSNTFGFSSWDEWNAESKDPTNFYSESESDGEKIPENSQEDEITSDQEKTDKHIDHGSSSSGDSSYQREDSEESESVHREKRILPIEMNKQAYFLNFTGCTKPLYEDEFQLEVEELDIHNGIIAFLQDLIGKYSWEPTNHCYHAKSNLWVNLIKGILYDFPSEPDVTNEAADCLRSAAEEYMIDVFKESKLNDYSGDYEWKKDEIGKVLEEAVKVVQKNDLLKRQPSKTPSQFEIMKEQIHSERLIRESNQVNPYRPVKGDFIELVGDPEKLRVIRSEDTDPANGDQKYSEEPGEIIEPKWFWIDYERETEEGLVTQRVTVDQRAETFRDEDNTLDSDSGSADSDEKEWIWIQKDK